MTVAISVQAASQAQSPFTSPTMAAVASIPVPMCEKEQLVFYRRAFKDSKAEIVSINKAKNELHEQLNMKNTELNKAIKYLL